MLHEEEEKEGEEEQGEIEKTKNENDSGTFMEEEDSTRNEYNDCGFKASDLSFKVLAYRME